MADFRPHPADSGIPPEVVELCTQYEAEWDKLGNESAPPDVTGYLSRVAPAQRPALQQELERILHENMARLGTVGTIQINPPGKSITANLGPEATIDGVDPANAPHAGPEATLDFSGGAVGATMDVPAGGFRGAKSAGLPGQDVSDFSLSEAAVRTRTGQWPEVPGYEIVGEIGRGGMGVVYKARQRGLNRWTALKMVLAGAHAGEQQLARFHTEAEAVALLQHPNIVQIYDVGEHDGLPYFSLEYIDGGALDREIHRKAQPPREAARLVEMLADAMQYAHQHGIIHRDLKPANVLLTRDGTPKITDFGLAKRLESDSSQTKSGTLMGTPSYMAPEQARGEVHDVGPLADVYALGAMLYELLTGRPPFLASTAMETIMQVTRDEPVAPTRTQANIPADIETICLKCLQKEPAKRYASAGALAEDLRRFLSGEPILARPISATERAWRWCRRNPWIAGSSAAIFVLLLAVAIGSTYAAVKIGIEKDRAKQNEMTARENEKVANEQADLALETVTMLITNVQDRLKSLPGQQARAVRRSLLQGALDGLNRVANRMGNEAAKQRNFGQAYLKMGIAAKEIGNSEEAYDYFERCYQLVKAALDADPENDRWRVILSAACLELGELSQNAHRDMKKSLAYYQENLALRQKIAAVSDAERRRLNEKLKPEERLNPFISRLYLSEAYLRVALTNYYTGDSAQAEAPILSCLRIRERMMAELLAGEASWCFSATTAGGVPISVWGSLPFLKWWAGDQRQNLARNYHLAAEIYLRLRDRITSGSYYGKVVEIREALHAANPDDYELLGDLAEFYSYYGDMYLKLGDPQSALAKYDRSIELGREIVAKDNNVQYRRNLGTALYSRGLATLRMKDAAGAAKYLSESLQIREEMARKNPTEQEKMNLMLILALSDRQAEAAAIAEAVRLGREKDQELHVTIARGYAECAATTTGEPKTKRSYEEKAVAALQAAVAAGYKDVMILETDPDLQPIRDLPEFKKLLERVKARTATATARR
jgi:tetratricopeptide (TPR) repeat protein/tRNA A-37 threonylcarbamoyl transferase component Bud32